MNALADFDKELRTLIRSRHGIAVSLNYAQVQGVLKAVNLPHGNAFMDKLRQNGLLRALPALVGGHARYGIDEVVQMVKQLNGVPA